MHAYITLSLLCGLRTEEARALRWAHVDLSEPNPRTAPESLTTLQMPATELCSHEVVRVIGRKRTACT